jgi:hypothetical protein
MGAEGQGMENTTVRAVGEMTVSREFQLSRPREDYLLFQLPRS